MDDIVSDIYNNLRSLFGDHIPEPTELKETPNHPVSKKLVLFEYTPVISLIDHVVTHSPRTGKQYKKPKYLLRVGQKTEIRLKPDGTVSLYGPHVVERDAIEGIHFKFED